MATDKENSVEWITRWLESQGYPLEMTVAARFQRAGFTVVQSDYYKDSETDKLREIDVTALKWSDLTKPTALQVSWSIECTLARNRPWIVFVSEAQPEQFLPFNMFASSQCRTLLLEAYKYDTFRYQLLCHPLVNPHRLAHGITQAFTSGPDVPYTAVMNAVKASADRVTAFDEVEQRSSSGQKQRYLCISFPAVVIDGRLFECCLEGDEKVNLTEVQSTALYWRGSGSDYASPVIHILTKQELPKFIQQASEAAKALIDITLVGVDGG